MTRAEFLFILERLSGQLLSQAGKAKMDGNPVASHVLAGISEALFRTVEEMEAEGKDPASALSALAERSKP